MSSTSSTNGNRPTPPGVGTTPAKTKTTQPEGLDKTTRPTPPSSSDTYRPAPPAASRPTPPAASRPTPPAAGGELRPVPPSANRPTPPAVDDGYDRPVPPAVHVPRYYWQPSFPVVPLTNPRPLPHIELPPAPAGARKLELDEVSNDTVGLLGEFGRLRDQKKTLFVTTHPKLTGDEAKTALKSGKTIYLAPDDGPHLSSDKFKPITKAEQLDPLRDEVRNTKLGQLQKSENRAADARRSAWLEGDLQTRLNALPAFNSVYDTNRLALTNYMVTEGGKQFNRNMITAMNVYNQSDVRREIATNWQARPDMGTAEFNRMANRVVSTHVQNLYWRSDYMGDWGTYLGSNPVPGLRYPDTQEDIDYNSNAIKRVASELPLLLNNSVLD